jgi:hypothetical protein
MDRLIELKNYWDEYNNQWPKQATTIQMIFSLHNEVVGGNENQWHCSSCVKRVMDRVQRHLKNNNMI